MKVFLNTKFSEGLLNLLNPTLNCNIGEIQSLPLLFKHSLKVNPLAQSCIAISREDWDARETSWDFQQSELLRHQTGASLRAAVETYETHWQGRFQQLHQNEEALNRIFIDLYGLQDELTAEVDPDDITILGQEAKPDPTGKLAFDRRELMAQFISYAVGCMFGRYSLDNAGLILASQGQTLTDYARLTAPDASATTHHSSLITPFSPDADNIIPILDDDWFADDIVARFRAFVRAALPGTDSEFSQNMTFIEECLGIDIRK